MDNKDLKKFMAEHNCLELWKDEKVVKMLKALHDEVIEDCIDSIAVDSCTPEDLREFKFN